jgi:predicted tellurium resistance membrane protein TerC
LKLGLSLVLVFIGIKMLIDPHDQPPRWFQYDISTSASLLGVAGIILLSIIFSIIAGKRDRK